MPRGGIKGNRGNANPKIRSSDMDVLIGAAKELSLANPDSPEINKKSLKKIEREADSREDIVSNAKRYADLIVNEIGTYDKSLLKNASAVDLDDCRAVMERSRDYFYGCANAAMPPTINSYCCIALGLSVQRVNTYVRTHNNATTEFILKVKDMIADQMVTASLKRSVDNVTTIFELKNHHGYADNIRIEASMSEQAPEIDEDALKAEYMKYAAENGIDITPDSEDK